MGTARHPTSGPTVIQFPGPLRPASLQSGKVHRLGTRQAAAEAAKKVPVNSRNVLSVQISEQLSIGDQKFVASCD